jgi:hypothetical protein
MGDFPSQVQAIQSPAVAGDFCDANPRSTVDAGPGALVAGQGVINGVLVQGAVVGRFGWLSYQQTDGDGAPAVVDTFGSGLPAGLVHRTQQGLITAYLGAAVEYLLSGFQIELFSIVGMWVENANASAQALPGMKAFARYSDGAVLFAAAGATPSGGSSTASIAAATNSVEASIVDNVMYVTTVNSGVVRPGTTLSGSHGKVVEQLLPLESGESLGGIGRYALNIPGQNVATGTITGTYGIMTAGTVTGAYNVGETVTGSGISVTTTITQQITGSPGAAGTYAVDVNTVVGSTTITSADSIETEWYCKSAGAAGDLVKIARVK